MHHGSKYVLLYSSNGYGGDKYAIGYATATATSLLGPWTKHPTPLLSTSSSKGRFRGPGGQDVVAGPGGRDYLVFHSWDPACAYRGVSVLPLTWKDDEPVVTPKSPPRHPSWAKKRPPLSATRKPSGGLHPFSVLTQPRPGPDLVGLPSDFTVPQGYRIG